MATITLTSSGTWRAEARVTKNGKRVFREIRHFDNKRDAEDWGRDTEARVKATLATGRTLPTDITLSEAMTMWEEDLRNFLDNPTPLLRRNPDFDKLARSTEKNKGRRKAWREHRLGCVPLRTITQVDIEMFIDDRRDDEISDSTIINDLAVLAQLYEHATSATDTCRPTGWQWDLKCPIQAAKQDRKLKQSRLRERRLRADELNAIHEVLTQMGVPQ